MRPVGEGSVSVELEVNGKLWKGDVMPGERLLDTLRERMGLTGTKEGCGGGECGACTVILDGVATCSCLTLTAQLDGSEITTIEGLEPLSGGGEMHPIQQAFIDAGAVQCGYCTPGMILSAKALLDRNPSPTREEIREAISGNICRCTGYAKIVDAVALAAQRVRGDARESAGGDGKGGKS